MCVVVAGHKITFIHPKSAVGVLVELVQAPTSVIAAFKAAEAAEAAANDESPKE